MGELLCIDNQPMSSSPHKFVELIVFSLASEEGVLRYYCRINSDRNSQNDCTVPGEILFQNRISLITCDHQIFSLTLQDLGRIAIVDIENKFGGDPIDDLRDLLFRECNATAYAENEISQ